jgi:hypothetical protein
MSAPLLVSLACWWRARGFPPRPVRPATQRELQGTVMIDRTQSQEDSTLAQGQVRAAANQSLAREVNERIDQMRPPSTFLQFVCECALEDCDEMLALTEPEYEALRAHANRFVVAPDHVVAQVEVVVESTERFVTVMMIGAGATVARHFDPRHRQSHMQALTELPAQNLI